MQSIAGPFIWYQLMTPDPMSARAFYGVLVKGQQQPVPGGNYAIHAMDPQAAALGMAGPRKV